MFGADIYSFKIVIIGECDSGNSSLISRFAMESLVKVLVL